MTKDSLKEYRAKRDFLKTSEPKGDDGSIGNGRTFVIQKHHASQLHYDLRLEVNGVLKSWAVPKGPSTDPGVKRLAQPTEDHPLDYAQFEGVIPAGEYGAGTVMVWDTGTYRDLRGEKDNESMTMEKSLEDGKVEVYLEGKKLQGGYALIRTGKGDDSRWLLIKMSDDKANRKGDVLKEKPNSALTGRSLEEISEEKSAQK